MTREEREIAVKEFKEWRDSYYNKNKLPATMFIEEAIKALEEEPIYYPPCIDCNKKMDEIRHAYDKLKEQEPSRDMEEIAEVINCDADAEAKCRMISNILTAKPHYFEKQELSGDLINRQAVISMQYRIDDSATLSTRDVVNVDDIESLPSVNPQERTGHWDSRTCKCSECGYQIAFSEYAERKYKFCPDCGADMRGADS